MSAEIIGYRYQLLERLGSGGMGSVYRAFDRLTGEHVAIKRVNTGNTVINLSADSAQKFRKALAQEFHVLATMRHPHVISVVDYGFDDRQQPFYAMELLPNAQNLLVYGHDKPFMTRLHLLIQTLQAIAYLHRRGIMHRDLKPDNILIVKDQVKVLDFGLAISTHALGEKPELSGTIAYMAPEVFLGHAPTFATDLYAFGVIAYELLAGEHPFSMNNITELIRDIVSTPPNMDIVSAPEAVVHTLERLLAKDPHDRYQDAEPLLNIYADIADMPSILETYTIRESYLQTARFIGRQNELNTLRNALNDVPQTKGSLWLVGGESGVGKSRLMEELRTWALVDGVIVLRGQAIVEGGAPYLLWRNVLRYLCLKIEFSDQEASVLQVLVPDIATLIGRVVLPAPELDPEAEQARLLNTLESVFSRHNHPTLIIMEDLQWAQESLTVMNRLSHGLHALPLMIVGTYRDDESPELPYTFAEAHHIRLERLKPVEIADLSGSILGDQIGRQESLVKLLEVETEGNVFFIVEIVRALAESAGQFSEIGRKTLPATIFAGGIQTVVNKRLGDVPSQALKLLQLMAIAGREVDLKLLQHLEPSVHVDVWLLDCSSVLDISENRWRFAHDKLRDGLIAQIPPGKMATLYRQVALAIEEAYPNDPSQTVRLAYLWRDAKDPVQEAHYCLLAGKQSMTTGNYQESLRFLQRAIELTPKSDDTLEQRAILFKQLGDAHYGLGRLNESRAYFRDTLASAKRPTPSSPQTILLSIAMEGVRQLRHQLFPSLTPKESVGLFKREVANACSQLSLISYFKNEKYLAFYYSLVGMNIAAEASENHRDELAHLQSNFALLASVMPLHRLARRYRRLANQNIPPRQNARVRSWVLMMSGIYATNTAEWDIAVPSLVECIELAEFAGNVRRYQEALVSLAAAYFFKSDWVNSYIIAEKLLESGLKYNNLQSQAWGLDDLGRVLYHQGHHDKALELFGQSRRLYEQIQDVSGLIWVYGGLAQVYTRLGNLDEARPFAEQLREWLLNTPPSAYGLLEGYQGLADFYLAQYDQWRTPDNQRHAETAVMLVHRFGRIFNTGKAYRYIYDSWFSFLKGEPSRGLRLGKLAIQEAQRYHLTYEEGLAGYYLTRFLPEAQPQRASYRASAQAIFQGLNAQWDLERLNGLE